MMESRRNPKPRLSSRWRPWSSGPRKAKAALIEARAPASMRPCPPGAKIPVIPHIALEISAQLLQRLVEFSLLLPSLGAKQLLP